MAAHEFQELVDAVARSATVKDAALELIRDLSGRLRDIADHPTPEEVRALVEKLTTHADALADGISEHDA